MSDRQRCVTADRPEAGSSSISDLIAGADAPIAIPSASVRAYLKTFGLVAIVAYADGWLSCTLDIGRPLRGHPT